MKYYVWTGLFFKYFDTKSQNYLQTFILQNYSIGKRPFFFLKQISRFLIGKKYKLIRCMSNSMYKILSLFYQFFPYSFIFLIIIFAYFITSCYLTRQSYLFWNTSAKICNVQSNIKSWCPGFHFYLHKWRHITSYYLTSIGNYLKYTTEISFLNAICLQVSFQ